MVTRNRWNMASHQLTSVKAKCLYKCVKVAFYTHPSSPANTELGGMIVVLMKIYPSTKNIHFSINTHRMSFVVYHSNSFRQSSKRHSLKSDSTETVLSGNIMDAIRNELTTPTKLTNQMLVCLTKTLTASETFTLRVVLLSCCITLNDNSKCSAPQMSKPSSYVPSWLKKSTLIAKQQPRKVGVL